MRDGGGLQPPALPRVCWGPEDARGDARVGTCQSLRAVLSLPSSLSLFSVVFFFFFSSGICTSFHHVDPIC